MGLVILGGGIAMACGVIWAFVFRSSKSSDSLGVIEESNLQFDHDGTPFVQIRFKFLVNEQPYWGNQTIRESSLLNGEKIATILQRYSIGAGVIVYFDPQDIEYSSTLDEPHEHPRFVGVDDLGRDRPDHYHYVANCAGRYALQSRHQSSVRMAKSDRTVSCQY